MSIEHNVQIVMDFFTAAFGGDREAMLTLVAEDIEWIVPGQDWPLAGINRCQSNPNRSPHDVVRALR